MKKLLLIILGILIGAGGYYAYDNYLVKKEVKTKIVKEKCETKEKELCENVNLSMFKFNENNILNADLKTNKYSSSTTTSRNVQIVPVSTKEFNLNIYWNEVNKFALINKKTNMETQKLAFDKNVEHVFIGSVGQDATYETVFFVMEDGTVEYMPVFHALKNNSIKTYGKVDASVGGVYRIAEYSKCPRNGTVGCGVTVMAQRYDGKYYDLGQYISKMNYYN